MNLNTEHTNLMQSNLSLIFYVGLVLKLSKIACKSKLVRGPLSIQHPVRA